MKFGDVCWAMEKMVTCLLPVLHWVIGAVLNSSIDR